MVVGGGGAEEGKERCGVVNRLGGEAVQEVGGSGESLHPVAGWEGGLKEETTEHVIGSANHTLSSTILMRGVGTGEAELDTVGEEEST